MATMIGPLSLTVGQPYKLSLPVESRMLDVQNDTQYDLWIYFGNVAPTDLTNDNNTWHRVVRRGHSSTVPVEGFRGASPYERSNNAFAAFQGVAWIMLWNAGGIAATGTISARNQVYVTPMLPGDPQPIHAALATTADLSSQPRMVSVPIAVTQWQAGNWNPGANPTLTIETLELSATNLANATVIVYFYGASFMPGQASTGMMEFLLVAQPADSNSNPLGNSVTLFQGLVAANSTNDTATGCGWQSPFPLMYVWSLPTSTPLPANTARILIQLVKSNGGIVTMNHTVAVNIDQSNTVPVADIGNASLWKGPGGGAPLF